MTREAEFFGSLFRDCLKEDGQFIELRCINRHDDQLDQRFFSSIDDFLKAAKKQKPRWDYYFGVNPRDSRNGTAKAVKCVSCIWADLDWNNFKNGQEEAIERVRQFLVPVTVVVETGHGMHGYWLLKEPEELEDLANFRRIVKGVQKILGSDQVDDLPRVLRIPGTLNYKDLKNVLPCKIVFSDYSRRYVISDFEPFALSLEEDSESHKAAPGIEEKIAQGSRNRKLTSAAGSMRRRGMTSAEIDAGLQVMNKNRCQPSLLESEVRKIAESVSRYPSEPNLGSNKIGKLTQAQRLIELASDTELFHTSDYECYATFTVEGHKENWPIRSKTYRRFISRAFYEMEGKPPNNQALQAAIQLIEAKAQFDGTQEEVFTRVAGDKERIYLDLANDGWSAVEITSTGWSVVSDPKVKFRRSPGMLPLPYPERGGSLESLRPLINARSDKTWVLDVAWLIGGLNPRGPYPVDITLGEQGSAKSTRQRLKRNLIDPIKAPLRSAPRNGRDLMISAKNGWVITLDNLSQLPDWLSDALCRLATGGGFSTRGLYTNDEEMIFESCRPIAMNAIENMVHRPDLVDRALINNIMPIPEDERKTEDEILAQFEKAHPKILGALLDAVVMALRNYDEVKLECLPRMADFAKWVVAAEPALPWPIGKFLEVYSQNRSDAIETTLEADPLASAVRELMKDLEEWEGTSTELLADLEALVDEKTTRSDNWPGSAVWLTRKLKRPATFLRSMGIDIDFPEPGKGLPITIENRNNLQNTPSTLSTPRESDKNKDNNNLTTEGKTVGQEGKTVDKEKIPLLLKPLASKGKEGKKGKKGKTQPFSTEL